MSILNDLNSAIKDIDRETKSLQAVVRFSHYTSSNEYGTQLYDPEDVELRAIVDWIQRQVRTQSGVLSVSRARVTFLDIAALMLATNNEGIDDNDLIVLPDGTTGPILDMAGFIDAVTGLPVMTEVYLG